jgi:uncharacterized protein YndB with AHSA1/START domain
LTPSERRVDKSIELDASPEEVWAAVATGPGLSSWFVPHSFDEVSGEGEADFGGGQSATGRLLALEPGHRVKYGAPEGSPQDQNGFALEFLVEGRGQGSTVLRLMHSGFSGDNWELEYEGTNRGWDLFLHNLASYFTYFRGKPVKNVVAMTFTSADAAHVWEGFHQALGISEGISRGDKVTLTPAGMAPIEGVVDVYEKGAIGVRSDEGLLRFGGLGADFGGMVTATHYFYGVDLDTTEATNVWQSWLAGLFPAPKLP